MSNNRLIGWSLGTLASSIMAMAAVATSNPASAAEACDEACLDGFTNTYIAALSAHDPKSLPVAATVKFSENEVVKKLGDGLLWQGKGVVGTYRIYGSDPVLGESAFMGVLMEPGAKKATMFALRLKIVDQKITEIETIAPMYESNVFNKDFGEATAKLTTTRPAFSAIVPPSDRTPRQTLAAIGNSYYDGIVGGTGEIVAFGDDCHRIENGVATVNNPSLVYNFETPTGKPLPNFGAMGCKAQFNTRMYSTDGITGRRILVDQQRGNVFVFSQYHDHSQGLCADVPNFGQICKPKGAKTFSLAMLEVHHVKDDKIHEQESVWVLLPSNDVKSPWPAP